MFTSIRRQQLGEGQQGQMLQLFHYQLCVRRHGGWLPPSADQFSLKLPLSPAMYVTSLGLEWVCVPPHLTQSAQQKTVRRTDHKGRLHMCVRVQQNSLNKHRKICESLIGWDLETSNDETLYCYRCC